jgi:TusE/DsrC/DsvC family sulfur relay protein
MRRIEMYSNQPQQAADSAAHYPPRFDSEGYLVDSQSWRPELAEEMASGDGIALTEDHWTVIHFLRRFYEQYTIAPGLSLLRRSLCKEFNDCKWDRKYLHRLFQFDGHCYACRYAGLPKPFPEGV